MTKRKKIAIISAITIALITLIIIILIVAFKKDDDGKGTAYVTSICLFNTRKSFCRSC